MLRLCPALLLLLTAPVFQAQPPRDAPARPPEPAGTGRITGVVVAADNGAPVKRATVAVSSYGGSPPRASTTTPAPGSLPVGRATLTVTSGIWMSGGPGGRPAKTTDEAGRFELTDLAPGEYSLMVNAQSGFVPMRQSPRVTVKDGETATISIKLDRTGAITGRILDESGDPLPRARVSALRAERGMRRMVGPGAMTDDLGQYRLFDLVPGEYYVTASSGMSGMGNEPAGSLGFAATYYPGTAIAADAHAVTVKSAQDTPSVDFPLARVPMGSVSGTVRTSAGELVTFDPRSGPSRMNASVSLNPIEQETSSFVRGAGLRPDGTFLIGGVPPGRYVLVANITHGQGPDAATEGAYVPVTVNGDEQRVDLQCNRGATMTGRVVIEGNPPPLPPGVTSSPDASRPRIGVRSVPGRPQPGRYVEPVQPDEEGAFQLKGLRGPILLQVMPLGNAVLKSIMYAGTDLAVTPLELTGTERLSNVLVTMTTETGRLEGTVTKDGTEPAPGAMVVVFPDDADRWYPGSPFVVVTGSMGEMPPGVQRPPDIAARMTPGRFTTRPMLPGRYYVLAFERSDDMIGFSPDRASLEKLRSSATSVTVAAGGVTAVQVRLQKP